MKRLLVLLLIFITSLISACGNNAASSENSGEEAALKIYTTVYPLHFFTEQIAGEAAVVKSILPPGADAHTFEPTTKEMVRLAESDAFIYNGAGLEAYAETIAEAIESEDVALLEAAKAIDLKEHLHDDHTDAANSSHKESDSEEKHQDDSASHEGEMESHEGHGHGNKDPHIWLDPLRSIQLAENIKNLLVELKPEQEEQFNKNFAQLKQRLKKLDEKFHTQLKDFANKEIIVSHAAYGYWEQAYGIEQIAVSGLSPTNEPSQKELEDIIETAKTNEIEYVFFEQNITPKVAEVVQKEIGAEPLRIHNLSVLTEENIQNGDDYFSIMKENLAQLNKALSQ